MNARARGDAQAVAAANRAAAAAANSHEAAFARERALFLGAEGPEAPGAAPADPAAQRARRREGAARFGRKALASFMAVVLAVGLMPLPAFGDDGQVRGVSFNGNLIAGSVSTTTTVDEDGNVTSETTQTKVDDEGNVVSETTSSGDGGLDSDANLRGQYYLGQATTLKSDGTIQDLAGTGDIGKVADGSDSRLSVAAGAQALEDRESEAGQSAVDEAQAAFDAEDEQIDISGLDGMDFSSQRIVVALEDGAQLQQRDLNNVTSRADDVYVLAYKDADAAKRAYVRYASYDGAAFAAPDAAVEASDGDGGGDEDDPDAGLPDVPRTESGEVDYTVVAKDGADADGAQAPETGAPEVDTSTYEADARDLEEEAGGRAEEEAGKPDSRRTGVVVVIDTMVAQDLPVARRLSVLAGSQEEVAEDDADRDDKVKAQHDRHGSKMVETILEQLEAGGAQVVDAEGNRLAGPEDEGARKVQVISIEALDANDYGSAASVLVAAQLALRACPDVVNMSFAGYATEGNAAISEAVKLLADGPDAERGTPDDADVVAAAGNQGQDARFFVPASSDGAYAVGALDAAKVEALREATARELFPDAFAESEPKGSIPFGSLAGLDAEVAARIAADPAAYKQQSSNSGDAVDAWLIAGSTSYAAALAAGYAAANPQDWRSTLAASPLAVGDSREFAIGEAEAEKPAAAPEADGGDGAEADAENPDAGEPGSDGADLDAAAGKGVLEALRGKVLREGVLAQDGAVSVDLGTAVTTGVGMIEYETSAGTAHAGNWFRLSGASVAETSSEDITRLTITSSAATSTSGVFVHVPEAADGYSYIRLGDALSDTTARHKEYIVVFTSAISAEAATTFLRENVYFVCPQGNTPDKIADSGATITVRADCAESANGDRLSQYSWGYRFPQGGVKAGDSLEHFYTITTQTSTLANGYNYAKEVVLDGSRGYLATPMRAEENKLISDYRTAYLGGPSGSDPYCAWIGLGSYTVTAPDALTWSGLGATQWTGCTTSNADTHTRWLCGPEAGDLGGTFIKNQIWNIDQSGYAFGIGWSTTAIGNGVATAGYGYDDISTNSSRHNCIEFSGYNRVVAATGAADLTLASASLSWSKDVSAQGDGAYDIGYTGAAQEVPLDPGVYKLEAWGAAGGAEYTYSYDGSGRDNTGSVGVYRGTGGNGGYAVGTVAFAEPTTVYAYVGEFGENSGGSSTQNNLGKSGTVSKTESKNRWMFNGGGRAGNYGAWTNYYLHGQNGGGATHFSLNPSGQIGTVGTALAANATPSWNPDGTLVIAGGGGGKNHQSDTYMGGVGGGIAGTRGSYSATGFATNVNNWGTQISGFTQGSGQGTTSSDGPAGGGGWYGGYATGDGGFGSGGSGHIGDSVGFELVGNTVTSGYSDDYWKGTGSYSGKGYDWSQIQDYAASTTTVSDLTVTSLPTTLFGKTTYGSDDYLVVGQLYRGTRAYKANSNIETAWSAVYSSDRVPSTTGTGYEIGHYGFGHAKVTRIADYQVTYHNWDGDVIGVSYANAGAPATLTQPSSFATSLGLSKTNNTVVQDETVTFSGWTTTQGDFSYGNVILAPYESTGTTHVFTRNVDLYPAWTNYTVSLAAGYLDPESTPPSTFTTVTDGPSTMPDEGGLTTAVYTLPTEGYATSGDSVQGISGFGPRDGYVFDCWEVYYNTDSSTTSTPNVAEGQTCRLPAGAHVKADPGASNQGYTGTGWVYTTDNPDSDSATWRQVTWVAQSYSDDATPVPNGSKAVTIDTTVKLRAVWKYDSLSLVPDGRACARAGRIPPSAPRRPVVLGCVEGGAR